MSHIPKSAQRKIDAANRARAARTATGPHAGIVDAQPPPTPKRLDITTMPGAYCRAFNVYFNGVKQNLCQVADVERGYITRYLRGDSKNRPLPPYETATEHGAVVIKRKALDK